MKEKSSQYVPFAERMRSAGLPERFIDNFAHYYGQLLAGDDGLIPESAIQPVKGLVDAETFTDALAGAGTRALRHTVAIKLNGGLGTSMGLTAAKSLLIVKEGLTFLDIIAHQVLCAGVPLLLMNSFATDADSLAVLRRYPELATPDLSLSFVQHKQPKVTVDGLSPAVWPEDPELEWCPPGHGDLYIALVTSGMLARLLARGIEYAFVSNADNLGATLDLGILGYFASERIPFLMEVADRTPSDRKGGHLACRRDGRLVLRELAQCPEADRDAFQDISRYRYFNTNNLWLHLPTLARVMEEQDYFLGLPMIRNLKTVDPRDKASPKVYQLETAMGSAIAVFEGAQAVRVPRSRFAPVKKTDDLLAVRSDAYRLTEHYRIELAPERGNVPPVVQLDPECYGLIDEMDARFPHGAPSLLQARSFQVKGDFRFGCGVVARGDVRLENAGPEQKLVPDGIVLEDETWP
jgi:UTP--glucose-1-phosphate uridylyltransferase